MNPKDILYFVLVGAAILVVAIIITPFCNKPEITVPPGYKLCAKDPDCQEGYYCGFVPGYTAAVCRERHD